MYEQRFLTVRVECYAGHRGEQTPRTLMRRIPTLLETSETVHLFDRERWSARTRREDWDTALEPHITLGKPECC